MKTPPAWRLALGCLAFALVSVSAKRASSDDAGAPPVTTGPTASLGCEASEGPGRVRCEVEARVPAGSVLRWGDVVLVSAPDFVVPLRGRVGPHEATTREPARWRWAFAVVARERGRGPLAVRARLVVCQEESDGRTGPCAPVSLELSTTLSVGTGKP